jgi:hypothetical protein
MTDDDDLEIAVIVEAITEQAVEACGIAPGATDTESLRPTEEEALRLIRQHPRRREIEKFLVEEAPRLRRIN